MYTKPTSKMKYRGHQYDGLNNLIQTFNPYLNVGQDLSNLLSSRQSKDLYDLNYNDYLSAYEVVTPEIEKAARQEALNSVNAYKNTLGTTLGQTAAGIGTGIEFAQGAMRDYSDLDTTNPDNVKNVIYGTGNVVSNLGANLFNRHNTFIEGMDDSHFDFNHNVEGTTPLADAWNNQNLLSLNTKPRQPFKEAVGDNLKAQAKGAMIGSTFGPVGTAVGAAVGFVGDIANKLFANRNYKDIAKANAERNRRLLNEANESAVWANKNWNMKNMINYSALGGKLFDQGGPMLNRFETGGSHEENPYGGILQGMAPDGQPNLVEQGETKWNDENYIFSKRLKVTKQLAKEFNLPKEFIGKSFADAVSKWGEKFEEMENDALAIATQNAIYTRASEAQEALRANKMMKQLNEQMANLTPEEQQTLLTQMQQQPMETQQMKYPMGSEIMQNEIPQGYAEGGHLFAGPFSFTTFSRRLQYNPVIPNQQSFFDYVDQLQKQYPDNWAWMLNRNLNSNNSFTLFNQNIPTATALKEVPEGLQDPVVITPTPEENIQVANTAVDWAALSKNKPTYGNWTKDTPQPENAHEQMFAKALNEYWQKRYDDAKTSEDYKKIADDYNDYQNLYAEIAQHAGDEEWMKSDYGKKAIKDLQGKWRTFSHNSNSRGLNQYVTKDMMKDIFQTVNKTTNSEPDDLKDGVIVDPDGLWGVQTAARYMGITDPELLKKLEAVGITQGEYAPGAWFNRLSYAAPTPQNADNPQNQSEEKKEDTLTEGIRETPDLLPTGMRNIGAVLPFLFANQKSEYPRPLQAPMIGFSPIADYLQYRPLDKQYYLNTANARQQNLRNNIINMSGGNRAAAANRLMLADLQAQDEAGKLYKMAEEYNADQRAKVAQQNAAINEFNSKGFYDADEWNARTAYDAATRNWDMNNKIDAMTAQARSANLTQGIQNLIEIGNENARLNMINSNPAYVAGLDPNFAVAFKKLIEDSTKGTNAKCGGYLTIKKRK